MPPRAPARRRASRRFHESESAPAGRPGGRHRRRRSAVPRLAGRSPLVRAGDARRQRAQRGQVLPGRHHGRRRAPPVVLPGAASRGVRRHAGGRLRRARSGRHRPGIHGGRERRGACARRALRGPGPGDLDLLRLPLRGRRSDPGPGREPRARRAGEAPAAGARLEGLRRADPELHDHRSGDRAGPARAQLRPALGGDDLPAGRSREPGAARASRPSTSSTT